MLWLFVRTSNAWHRARQWMREESGLTIVEYGVFAAFVVLLLVGAALLVGPKMKDWVVDTVDCIIDKKKSGCDRG